MEYVNEDFLKDIFISKRAMQKASYSVVESPILFKSLVIFGVPGSGKTSIANYIAREATKYYGANNVNARYVSNGEIGFLIRFGVERKLVNILFIDNLTLVKVKPTTLQSYFKIRHHPFLKGLEQGYVLSIVAIHRFHSSPLEVRTIMDGLIVLDCLDPTTNILIPDGIESAYKIWYEGPMIRVNDIIVTPNHRFLTQHSWVKAKDIKKGMFIYSGKPNGKRYLDSRRNSTSAEDLFNNFKAGTYGNIPYQIIQVHPWESFKDGTYWKETLVNPWYLYETSRFVSNRSKLFSWTDRWRRDDIVRQNKLWEKSNSLLDNSEHKYGSYRLHRETIKSKTFQCPEQGQKTTLESSDKRLSSIWCSQESLSFLDCETTSSDESSRVFGKTWASNLQEAINRKGTGYSQKSERIELDKQRVETVEWLYNYEGFIYDFSTPSKQYFLGDNLLITHNSTMNPYDRSVLNNFVGSEVVEYFDSLASRKQEDPELKSLAYYKSKSIEGWIKIPLVKQKYMKYVFE